MRPRIPPCARDLCVANAVVGLPVVDPDLVCPDASVRPWTGGSTMQIRRRHIPLIPATALAAVIVPTAFAVAPRALAQDGPTANASVVKVENRKAPRTKVIN